MRIFKTVVGLVDTNCYIAYDVQTREAIMIDPGAVSAELNDAIEKLKGFDFRYILLTHGHFDHIGAAAYYEKLTGAKILIHELDEKFILDGNLNLGYNSEEAKVEPFKAYKLLKDNDSIEVFGKNIKVLHTPGHTCGSCCYIIDDIIFTGDTVMKLSVGRTDFPTGSISDLMKSVEKLKSLDGNYKLYPGHMDSTDLDYECKNNFYFKS